MSLIPFAGAVQKFNRSGGGGAAGYQIERSLRFNSADSAYLNRTPGSAGNRRTWTWSGWVKRSAFGGTQSLFARNDGSVASYLIWNSNNKLEFSSASGSVEAQIITTPIYRDASAWYHVTMALDTTQGTSSNRVKLYINGVQVTALDTASYPSQNYDGYVNTTQIHYIGAGGFGGSLTGFFNGYLTEINFIDGSALDPTSFGEFNETTGVWQPKAYTGSYGTNGFYLNFSDNSGTTSTTLGKDQAGSNNWTPNNFSVTAGAGNDSLVDTPTPYGTDTGVGGEVRGNYATWNALVNNSTLTNGNLQIAGGGSTVFYGSVSTIGISSGQWYWEITNVSNNDGLTGIVEASQAYATFGPTASGTTYIGYQSRSYSYHSNGNKYNNGSSSAYGASYTTNDVVGVAFNADTGTLVFYKNGVSQGTAFTVSAGYTWFPGDCVYTSDIKAVNFGQRPFVHTPPSGFKALCTQNLPEPTIADGGEYFNTVLYTGNNTAKSVTGVGFQPDFVWIKRRDATQTFSNAVIDAVRGRAASLVTNLANAEATSASDKDLTAFTSDGFDLNASNQVSVNDNAGTYVAWNWKANGAGVTNNAGTITSSVSVNTTAGFSIVTYTGNGTGGATIGHGLGAKPDFIIVKNRSTSANWIIYFSGEGANRYGYLNLTNAWVTDTTGFHNVEPTSTVFSVGTAVESNGNGNNMVAYAFRNIDGYSKFSTYVGNGSNDGPFVYTGHRPAFVAIKRLTSGITSGWILYDEKRSTYNVVGNVLEANDSAAEGVDVSTRYIDFLSNGFRLRTSASALNHSDGGTYVYMSFASNPFRYSLAR